MVHGVDGHHVTVGGANVHRIHLPVKLLEPPDVRRVRLAEAVRSPSVNLWSMRVVSAEVPHSVLGVIQNHLLCLAGRHLHQVRLDERVEGVPELVADVGALDRVLAVWLAVPAALCQAAHADGLHHLALGVLFLVEDRVRDHALIGQASADWIGLRWCQPLLCVCLCAIGAAIALCLSLERGHVGSIVAYDHADGVDDLVQHELRELGERASVQAGVRSALPEDEEIDDRHVRAPERAHDRGAELGEERMRCIGALQQSLDVGRERHDGERVSAKQFFCFCMRRRK